MEESAKRRERLQAMRLEASRAAANQPSSYSSPASAAPPLPLPQLSGPPLYPPPGLESPPPAPRFDFYTDPTSAFSATKRMRGAASASGFSPSSPYRPTPPPPPSYPTGIMNTHVDSNYPSVNQFHMSQPPDSSSCGTPSYVPYNRPWRSPVQMPTPFSGHQGSPARGPGSWNRPSGSAGHCFPSYNTNSVLTSSHFGPGGSPMNNAQHSSPYSISGSGRGRQFSSGPSPRPTGGRGRSFNSKASAQEDIGSYYCKSMLEDPWCDLEPVVGNILEPMAGPGYWLPESISGKKSKASESESRDQFKSKSSLAEFLAASLEEAINDD